MPHDQVEIILLDKDYDTQQQIKGYEKMGKIIYLTNITLGQETRFLSFLLIKFLSEGIEVWK